MLSSKLSLLALIAILVGVVVTAVDKLGPNVEDARSELNKMQNQYHRTKQINKGNFFVDFIMKYSGTWAVYLTQCSENLYEIVSDITFHLQDKTSTFPITGVETLCLAGICLLFYGVLGNLRRLERQQGRVASLEQENANLRENNKMNRVMINELMAQNGETAMNPDLKKEIARMQEREKKFNESQFYLESSQQQMRQEIDQVWRQVQEMQQFTYYYQNEQRSNNTNRNNNEDIEGSSVTMATQNTDGSDDSGMKQQSYGEESNECYSNNTKQDQIDDYCSSSQEVACKDQTDDYCPRSQEVACKDQTDDYCPSSQEVACKDQTDDYCPRSQEVACKDQTDDYCPSSQEVACKDQTDDYCPRSQEVACKDQTRDYCPSSQEVACKDQTDDYCPSSQEVACKDQTDDYCPSSQEVACKDQTDDYCPRSQEVACKDQTDDYCPSSQEVACKDQTDDYCPRSQEVACKDQTRDYCPSSQEVACKDQTDDYCPSSQEVACKDQTDDYCPSSQEVACKDQTDDYCPSSQELASYINQLVHSCNASYFRIQKLEESHKGFFRFVDKHFDTIYRQLGFIAGHQKRLTDMVHCIENPSE